MEERDTLKEEAANTGDKETYQKYKMKRNEVSTLMKSAESNHHKEKFSNHQEDPKETWKAAYQILGKSRCDFPSQMMFGTKLISKTLEIANEMNKYFVSKIEKLKTRNVSTSESLTELNTFLSKKNIPEGGFSINEVNDEDIKKIIKKMKGKKSCGLDWICGLSLKLAAPFLITERH